MNYHHVEPYSYTLTSARVYEHFIRFHSKVNMETRMEHHSISNKI